MDIEGSLNGDRAQADSTEKSSGLSSLEELEDFATGRANKIPKGRVNGIPTKKEVKKTGRNKSEANFIDIEGSLYGDNVDSNKAEKLGEPMFPEEGPDLDKFFSPYNKKSVPVTEDISMVRHHSPKNSKRKDDMSSTIYLVRILLVDCLRFFVNS